MNWSKFEASRLYEVQAMSAAEPVGLNGMVTTVGIPNIENVHS